MNAAAPPEGEFGPPGPGSEVNDGESATTRPDTPDRVGRTKGNERSCSVARRWRTGLQAFSGGRVHW